MTGLKTFWASLEARQEVPNGEAKQEKEYMFFGLLKDFAQLEQADSIERQQQWEIRTEKGCVRVRRSEVTGETSYTLTSKVKREGEEGKEEVELEGSADLFEHFKLHATSGMLKDRYCFKVPDSELVWELDVFYLPNGEPVPWVKIDLEVEEATSLPDWPINFERVITNQNGQRTEEEERLVQTLFGNYYITKPAMEGLESWEALETITKTLFVGIDLNKTA